MVIGKLNIHHFSNYVTREKKSLPLGDACPPKSLRPIKKKLVSHSIPNCVYCMTYCTFTSVKMLSYHCLDTLGMFYT